MLDVERWTELRREHFLRGVPIKELVRRTAVSAVRAGAARGRPELCDVKSEERLEDPEFLAQVEATGLASAEAGLGYRVLSEPDRQLLVNVRWLSGFRERPAESPLGANSSGPGLGRHRASDRAA